jgi:hypothetical protein
MAELKTKPTGRSVTAFLNEIDDEKKRQDAFTILEMMRKATKAEPYMWGASIVGFGTYHYKYASGHEGDAPITGFSPRQRNLTLYVMAGFEGRDELLKRLGKHTTGKACLYINSLDDIHMPTLRKIVQESVKYVKKTHKTSLSK